jgi:hypothetical protein
MLAIGDDKQVALLRSHVGAGLIFLGQRGIGRGQAGTGGERREQQRAPCSVRAKHGRSMFHSGLIIAF